ncbi:MAG: DUF1573 domain-containing protein [Kiritimatiellae bacterium]|nr:DUF1573 domain-containing protein [Kiritimatiellia bacterium]
MKRTGVIFLLFLATVAMVAGAGRLEIAGPDTVDVGAFEPGECPVAVFRLKNAGRAPLRFTHVVTTCRCLELEDVPECLAPGQSGRLSARVRPGFADDSFSSTVLIETDSQETPYAHVTVKRAMPWNRASLYRTPAILSPSPTNGVRTFFLEEKSVSGKRIRIPAFLGVPKRGGNTAALPGIVLACEGSVDNACRRVRFWNAHGFAALAVDIACDGECRRASAPWPYHAVAAVVRAHSFLRGYPGIDTDRIGLTGIARGGYVVCLAAAVDERFAFAIPIDAGPFLGDGAGNGEPGGCKDKTWNAADYLRLVRAPFLWMDTTASPLTILQDHYRKAKTPQTLCIRSRDTSAAPWQPGEEREEPPAFALHMARDGNSGLPVFGTVLRRGRRIAATFEAKGNRVVKAALVAAGGADGGGKLRWRAYPAELRENHVEATLPEGTSAYYVNLSTEEGLVVSSGHETCTL